MSAAVSKRGSPRQEGREASRQGDPGECAEPELGATRPGFSCAVPTSCPPLDKVQVPEPKLYLALPLTSRVTLGKSLPLSDCHVFPPKMGLIIVLMSWCCRED